jgi:hypothetical protein
MYMKNASRIRIYNAEAFFLGWTKNANGATVHIITAIMIGTVSSAANKGWLRIAELCTPVADSINRNMVRTYTKTDDIVNTTRKTGKSVSSCNTLSAFKPDDE